MTQDQAIAGAKATLRAQVRAARSARRALLRPPGWAARSQRLAQTVLADPDVARACAAGAAVTAYASFGDEPPTTDLLPALTERGARVLLPVVRPHRVLAWAPWSGPSSLVLDRHGIPTPVAEPIGDGAEALVAAGVRVMLVPALAVAHDGTRLGQGGGFYDSLLAALPAPADGGPLRIGIVGPGEVMPTVPCAAHDARLDRVLVG